ncbi:MAG: hypothetical protein M0Z33_06850 [Actinomycetota bacterium]|nr:hypothetical protein [Actinomycetota bacterium]
MSAAQRRRGLLAPVDRPAPRARVPAGAIRVALVAVGMGLSLVVERSPALLVVSCALALAAALAPRYLWSWALVVVLALGELVHRAQLSWQFLVLLAGVHVLHALGLLAAEMPARSWFDPRVLVAPLVRVVAIQVPAQALAAGALLLLAPGAHGHRPVTVAAFAVIGVVALAGMMLVLLPRSARE